jgi:hypothetical protein
MDWNSNYAVQTVLKKSSDLHLALLLLVCEFVSTFWNQKLSVDKTVEDKLGLQNGCVKDIFRFAFSSPVLL